MGDIIETIVIGAGPAGLTAAIRWPSMAATSLVLEQDPVYVGGI